MQYLVIEDHSLFAEGLVLLLQQVRPQADCQVVETSHAALEILRQTKFDLVILDLKLPGLGGNEFLKAFRRSNETTPVLVVSASEELVDVRESIMAGAQGFISKSSSPREFSVAIKTIECGKVYVDPQYSYLLYATPQANDLDRSQRQILTSRQAQVLSCISNGLSNKQIADQLGMAENTVKVHISSLFRKFGVTNRTACTEYARRVGLIQS